MTQWWRFYSDAIYDPKLLRLSDAMFRNWITLLCLAAKNDGRLPSAQDIALTLRMKPTKIAEWITCLCRAGLLDKDETGFAPHNWNGRQYKSDVSTDRVKRFRNANRNVSSAVSETPPETEADTETEPEKKTTRGERALADDWPADFFDQFWAAYPKRTEKLGAQKKLAALRRSRSVTFAEILAGAKRYADSVAGNDPQFTKAPTVWLNKGCWSDEIPTGKNHVLAHANRAFDAATRPQTNGDATLAGLGKIAGRIRERGLAEREAGLPTAGRDDPERRDAGNGFEPRRELVALPRPHTAELGGRGSGDADHRRQADAGFAGPESDRGQRGSEGRSLHGRVG